MRLPQAAPGEGPKAEYEHFANWQVKGGEKHTAYIAGPAQWFVCHCSDRGTKPCLTWMTNDALPCRFCAMHKTPQTIAYVPVWRESDWRGMFVILYDTEREWVEPLVLHDRVQIGREREKGAQIWVRRCLQQEPRFNTTMERRRRPQDLTRNLLVIWKMPELVSWLHGQYSSDTAVSLDKPAMHEPPPVVPDPVAARMSATGAVDDALERLQRRAKEASRNGDGKH